MYHSSSSSSSSSNYPNYSYYPNSVPMASNEMENMVPFHNNPNQFVQYQNQNYQNYEHLNGNMLMESPQFPNSQQEPMFQDPNFFQNFSGNMEAPQYFENPINFDQFMPTPPLDGFDHFASATVSPPLPVTGATGGIGPIKEKKKRVKKVSTMHLNTSCSNCGTRDTKLWRRNENGVPECNPCNLYERVNGQKRPENLWNKKTLRRKRRPMALIQQTEESVEH